MAGQPEMKSGASTHVSRWIPCPSYGYNDSLELDDGLLPGPAKHSPDQVCLVYENISKIFCYNKDVFLWFDLQSIELTKKAMDFLRGIFQLYDLDNVCVYDRFSDHPTLILLFCIN